jgi:prophage regulatory protein
MAEQLRSFLRLKQVKALTGMSRSWIYDAIRRGAFPAPIPLGARAVAWDSADVAAWQERCIQLHSKAVA